MELQQYLRGERALRLMGWVACGLLLLFCGGVIFPPRLGGKTNAITGKATPATNSVNLSIGGETANLLSFNLQPVSPDGTFAESSELIISASTDSYTGYTLSIAAQSGDNTTELINTDTTNCPVSEERCTIKPLPNTLSGGILKSDYIDPDSSEDANVTLTAVNNTWGFNPSTYLDGNTQVTNRGEGVDERYFPVSTIETNFAKTSVANDVDQNDNTKLVPDTYTMKIGARVDINTPKGTYQNDTFVIKTVGNGAVYTINYTDATGEVTQGTMPTNQVGLTTYDTTVALSDSIPTRTGYYFGGWCTAITTNDTCNGISYAAGASFGIDQTSNDNVVTLYAIWTDCQPNKICYDKNNSSAEGTMGVQSVSSNANVVLIASNYSLDGYGFAGWSRNSNADTSMNNNNEYNYTIYGPNATVNTGDLSAAGMKLYAVWVPLAKDNNGVDLTFQTSNLFSTTLSSALGGGTLGGKPNGFVTALKDQRDGQVYAVAKLADENYWMIENLRIETDGTVGDNATDPNVTNRDLSQGYGGVFNGLADPETSNFSDVTTANSLYSTDGSTTYTITGGSSSYYGRRFPRYNNTNTNSRVDSPSTGSGVSIYSYGNYYTWAAAVANTEQFSSYSVSDTVGTSLCPSGWRLPLGEQSTGVLEDGSGDANNLVGSFSYLDRKMGGTGADQSGTDGTTQSKKWRSFPNNFIHSGRINNGTIGDRGTLGRYWTSSATSNSDTRRLYLDSSFLSPGTNSNAKTYGFAVRCTAGS